MKQFAKTTTFILICIFMFNVHLICNGTVKSSDWIEGEDLRTIIGFEQSGASSAQHDQTFFLDLYFSNPFPFLKQKVHDKTGPHLRAWGNVRVTSVPQQVKSSVGEFAKNFYDNVKDIKVNEVAQAVEFLAGLDYRLSTLKISDNRLYTMGFIFGFGAITPINPKSSLEIFKISPELKENIKYKGYDFSEKEYIAFVKPTRDRFFRQYFLGFRFKTLFEPETKGGNVYKRSPAILDLTLGMNDSVTGGRLDIKDLVLRVDGFYPLKVGRVNIYLFGTALLKTTHTKFEETLILEPAPSDIKPFPASNLIFINDEELDRDYYRIGIGVDLSGLFTK